MLLNDPCTVNFLLFWYCSSHPLNISDQWVKLAFSRGFCQCILVCLKCFYVKPNWNKDKCNKWSFQRPSRDITHQTKDIKICSLCEGEMCVRLLCYSFFSPLCAATIKPPKATCIVCCVGLSSNKFDRFTYWLRWSTWMFWTGENLTGSLSMSVKR